MKTFIIGIAGGVGSLLARELIARGDDVSGLVRRPEQQEALGGTGVRGELGDLTEISAAELAKLIGPADALVFSAGAGGTGKEATTAIDGDGVVKAIEAARFAGVTRFALVSVFPEAWRERNLGEQFDHYIAVKKSADIALTQSGLDWIILRPAVLLNRPGQGTVALGPAQRHEEISRADVAATLAELLHEPRITGQILELTAGDTPIPDAVRANVRDR
ncbi:NAD(P)H-binding protein [Streptomyces sp. TG1A-8]|uniref:NAD(P)H-binding protein n=1 Tax=Streptomyces sp. TG1A-8 TaxID=3051385 RepID=UPI00265B8E69|nr:NAD(P)H-binding protein [Streptomyces sp. TG1A-8]MDO0929665.1 NAD(P)H-binding protein [Streptomyces sp. TG1A-8]